MSSEAPQVTTDVAPDATVRPEDVIDVLRLAYHVVEPPLLRALLGTPEDEVGLGLRQALLEERPLGG